ncbi:MAG: YIP1 family protein [Janthinobacterium lividum]
MRESSSYPTSESGNSTKANLLRKVWTEPQATLRYSLAKCPDEYVTRLFVLGGITRAVGRAIAHYPGHQMSAAASLIFAIIGGSISGVITYTAYAWGMSLAGSWLGGEASSDQFKTVIGWALVPTIASLLLLPTLAVLGGEGPSLPLLPNALLLGCGLVQIVLGGWSTIILLKGVALVQGFRLGRSLVNVLLPGALLLIVILGVASLVDGLAYFSQ